MVFSQRISAKFSKLYSWIIIRKKRDNKTRLPNIKSRFYVWPQKFSNTWKVFGDILSVRATLITVFQKLFQQLAKYKIKFEIVKGEPIYWCQFYSSISLVALAKAAISAANSWKSTHPLLSWSGVGTKQNLVGTRNPPEPTAWNPEPTGTHIFEIRVGSWVPHMPTPGLDQVLWKFHLIHSGRLFSTYLRTLKKKLI